jgi:hypothetical protein
MQNDSGLLAPVCRPIRVSSLNVNTNRAFSCAANKWSMDVHIALNLLPLSASVHFRFCSPSPLVRT